MEHQLNSLKIKGFKSIKEQTVTLTELNVLIGQNGAGKTNFISLFRFLRNIIEQRLRNVSLKVGAESLLYYGSKETQFVIISLDFSPNVYEIILQSSNNNSLFVYSEKCGFWDKKYSSPLVETISSSSEESQLLKTTKIDKISQYVYDVLKEWRVYHFHDTSESAGMKKFSSMSDNKILLEDASNLATFLYVLKSTQSEYYERIVKTVQLVIPYFKDFVLEPDIIDNERIRLEWQDKYSDKTFTAHQLSDGSLRFICMATLLLQKELPKLIILDEPELGLHPSAITILSGLLKKASKRTQVIVSTQSINFVNEFDAENIIVVEHNEQVSIFKRLETEKLKTWLEEYTLGELWDKNVIGGKP